jgi:integrase
MIAEFMGHSSTDMLYKRYGHFTDEKRREAISLFDKDTKSTECAQNVPKKKNNAVNY